MKGAIQRLVKGRCFGSGFAATLLLLAIAQAGCSTHNLWNVTARTSAEQLAEGRHPAHTNRVFLTESELPKSVVCMPIAKIDAGTVTTENTERVLILMADKAREVGADAVIKVRVWRKLSGFSRSAPQ